MEVLLNQCILCEGRNELDTRPVENTVSNGQVINPVKQFSFHFGMTWLLYQKNKQLQKPGILFRTGVVNLAKQHFVNALPSSALLQKSSIYALSHSGLWAKFSGYILQPSRQKGHIPFLDFYIPRRNSVIQLLFCTETAFDVPCSVFSLIFVSILVMSSSSDWKQELSSVLL